PSTCVKAGAFCLSIADCRTSPANADQRGERDCCDGRKQLRRMRPPACLRRLGRPSRMGEAGEAGRSCASNGLADASLEGLGPPELPRRRPAPPLTDGDEGTAAAARAKDLTNVSGFGQARASWLSALARRAALSDGFDRFPAAAAFES
uniref:HhH1 domain-containing protein n=1 Tax=Macrostomum lignano TaxID=282301 RepID=A0A1I8F4P8_9PLAT